MNTKKTGEPKTRFILEDYKSKVEVVCFPREYIKFSYEIFDGNIVMIEGNVSQNKEKLSVGLTNINSLKELDENHKQKLYMLIDEETKGKMVQIKKIIMENKGSNSTYFAVNEEEKKEIIKLNVKYNVAILIEFNFGC